MLMIEKTSSSRVDEQEICIDCKVDTTYHPLECPSRGSRTSIGVGSPKILEPKIKARKWVLLCLLGSEQIGLTLQPAGCCIMEMLERENVKWRTVEAMNLKEEKIGSHLR